MFNAVLDYHSAIEDMVAEGDKVVTRYTWTATDKATNKKVTGWQIDIDQIVDGKIVEEWTRSDTLGTAQQLGLIPTPKKEK